MTTLQLIGAMLLGAMIGGPLLAFLIVRLVENDARYPEPAVAPASFVPARCIHALSWQESIGVEPDSQLRLCVRVRCTMCGDERLLPFQAPHNPPRNAADVLPFAHGSTVPQDGNRPHATRSA